jgi:hypothetical protein
MTNAITITRKANTVYAPYLPYAAYQNALALATALKGKIGETAEGNFKATFSSAKVAENFKSKWTADYNANRKVSVEPTKATAKKPTASKGNTKPLFASQKQYDKFVELANEFSNRLENLLDDNRVIDKYDGLTDDILGIAKKELATTSSTKKTAPKKSTTSSKKAPRKTKGNAFDYSVIKGKTTTDKNKALHKELVKMGHKDSRTPEYMSVWNARPWAK